MSVKLSQAKLKYMFQAPLASRTSSYIDPVLYKFTDGGVLVRQSSTDRIVALLATFKKEFFANYEPLGDIVVSPPELIAVLSDYFVARDIAISATETELILKSDDAEYKTALQTTSQIEVPLFDTKTKDIEGVLVIDKEEITPVGVYQVDLSTIKKLKKSWDTVRLNANGGTVSFTVETGTGKLTRNLVTRPVKVVEEALSVSHPIYPLVLISKFVPSVVKIVFTKTSEGDPGPTSIGVVTEEYSITYWLAPIYE